MSDGMFAAELRRIIREEIGQSRSTAEAEPRNAASGPEWLSLAAAAKRIGVSARTMRRYVASGRLRVFAVGPRTRRVRAADVDAMLLASAAPASEGTANLALLAAQARAK